MYSDTSVNIQEVPSAQNSSENQEINVSVVDVTSESAPVMEKTVLEKKESNSLHQGNGLDILATNQETKPKSRSSKQPVSARKQNKSRPGSRALSRTESRAESRMK